ncbi:MAG TPA: glycerate kinase [Ruminiclostridium sp.]|nr:glycerate kinase [Ruminiclostridium sp.]
MKKCVIIPDSFKGSLDSIDICELASAKVKKFFPACETISLPVADGGEGTVECFLHAMEGERITVKVHGPYMEEVDSFYGRFGDLSVIEMAAAAGLPMVGDRLNPSLTTTYGVGELIRHAVENGAKRIILGLGGSSTNDGGCGCASALGVKFYNSDSKAFVPTGGTLGQVTSIDISEAEKFLKGCEITAMCDIENPMHGLTGAAHIFGPQKGADPEMVKDLDSQMMHLDKIIQRSLNKNVSQLSGAGAAGAFGAGVVAFLGGTLKSGIETVLDIVGFDRIIQGADAIFTGEGKIDSQSLRGKVVIGVSRRAMKQNVPVYAVVGDISDDAVAAYDMGVTAIFSINRVAVPFSIAKTRSRADLQSTMEDIMRLIKSVENRC